MILVFLFKKETFQNIPRYVSNAEGGRSFYSYMGSALWVFLLSALFCYFSSFISWLFKWLLCANGLLLLRLWYSYVILKCCLSLWGTSCEKARGDQSRYNTKHAVALPKTAAPPHTHTKYGCDIVMLKGSLQSSYHHRCGKEVVKSRIIMTQGKLYSIFQRGSGC